MENKEFLKVVQAYDEGKAIQQKVRGFEEWKPFDGKWNTVTYTYRIKPEEDKPKYRPYQSAEEVLEDMRVHGDWVKCNGEYARITRIRQISYEDLGVYCSYDFPPYASNDGKLHLREVLLGFNNDKTFEKFTWTDGTPFGKMIEE